VTAIAVQPDRIGHVSLRVRNLRRSGDFYRDLFGLHPRQAEPPSRVSCVCAPADDKLPRFSLVLTQGLPPGSEISGLDHVSLVVATEEDVDELYRRATEMGARATQPRDYAGHYQAFVFDPDGYKIEVRAEERPAEAGQCSRHTDS